MCDTLKMITQRVNEKLGSNFNTILDILMNVYKDGDDCIGCHRDRETGWAEGTGFATLSFGAERDFQVKHETSGVVTTVLHRGGNVLLLPFHWIVSACTVFLSVSE